MYPRTRGLQFFFLLSAINFAAVSMDSSKSNKNLPEPTKVVCENCDCVHFLDDDIRKFLDTPDDVSSDITCIRCTKKLLTRTIKEKMRTAAPKIIETKNAFYGQAAAMMSKSSGKNGFGLYQGQTSFKAACKHCGHVQIFGKDFISGLDSPFDRSGVELCKKCRERFFRK